MEPDAKLDDMSTDELLAYTIELYQNAKAKVAAGEGGQELIEACECARKAIDEHKGTVQ